MKYGISMDCIFSRCEEYKKGESFSRIFEFLNSLGAEGIEINSYRKFEIDKNIYEKKLQALGNQNAFSVTLHNGYHELSSLDDNKRQKLLNDIIEQIDYNCRFFNPKLIVLHPGSPTIDSKDRKLKYDKLRESTLVLLEHCSKNGIRVVYENMRDQYPTPDNAELVALVGEEKFKQILENEPNRRFQRVGGRILPLLQFVRSFNTDLLGLCIDTGHANISEGEAMIDIIKKCGKTLFHIHASDNYGKNDDHLQPGMADINWKAFYSSLEIINYSEILLLESVLKFKKERNCSVENILKVIEEDYNFFKKRGEYQVNYDML
jgi:sugar phosphate isomerase/epimerase